MNILGIGTDIIECLRIAQMIERHGELFLNRVYTPHEIEYCSARKAANQHYAGRFAAKEAVGKALGSGVYFTWKEIEVRGRPKPGVFLSGRTAKWAAKVGAGKIELSMTHSRELAAAVAVVMEAEVAEAP